MCWSSISSQTLHRHRYGRIRGEKWVGKEEGSCATVEGRELESECALGWDAVLPRSSQLYSITQVPVAVFKINPF